jgi:hypothetical protein
VSQQDLDSGEEEGALCRPLGCWWGSPLPKRPTVSPCCRDRGPTLLHSPLTKQRHTISTFHIKRTQCIGDLKHLIYPQQNITCEKTYLLEGFQDP